MPTSSQPSQSSQSGRTPTPTSVTPAPTTSVTPAPTAPTPAPPAPPAPTTPAPRDQRRRLEPGRARPESRARGLLRAARPRQWVKNALVLVAPFAAGVLSDPAAAGAAVVAAVAFCLASAGGYLVNDACDAAADRAHPAKRGRPVAAGVVPARTAVVAGVGCATAGLAVAAAAGRWQLPAVVAAYLCLTTAYSTVLKRVVIVDLVAVAAGFVLRAVAGAAAVAVPMSTWFLVVTCLGSLFVVAGKREAELRRSGSAHRPVRATLRQYSREFLGYVRASTTGALLVAYCIWAFDHHTGALRLAVGASVLPFTVGVLRYAMLVDAGRGEAPEELLLRDRLLLVAAGLLVVPLVVAVYVL